MKETKVSVIIPVYNTEAYIKATLESIRHQSLKEIEIIVINDGSTDNSLKIIQSVADTDERIQIHSQENKGQSVARNIGIEKARGQYLYFMDSDDKLKKESLEECYRECQQHKLDFLFFDGETFGDAADSIDLEKYYQRTGHLKKRIYSGPEVLKCLIDLEKFSASPCLLFINKDYLERIRLRFYPGIIHEDELFTFILYFKAKKVGFIPKTFFRRRLRKNSVMTTLFSMKNFHGYSSVVQQMHNLRILNKELELDFLIEKRISTIINGVLYNARGLKMRDRMQVLSFFLPKYHHYSNLRNALLIFLPKDLLGRLIKAKRKRK